MTLKDLDPGLLDRPQVRSSVYEDELTGLTQDEDSYGVAKVLDEWAVPDKGKAGNAVQSLRKKYGPTASEAGFRFLNVPSDDKSVRYLTVIYDPSKIVDGAWESWWEANEVAKSEAKEAARAKKEAAVTEAEAVVAKIRAAQEMNA